MEVWNQVESKGKKRRGWNPMGIHVWWTKCKRKKKEKWKRKHMAKRKTKHKKSQFKITTTICKLITKKKKKIMQL